MKIFIDDERMPIAHETAQWVIVREGQQAIDIIKANHLVITAISFDNDLGGPVEGDDVLKAIVGTIFDEPLELPCLEEIIVHSANNIKAQVIINRANDAIRDGKLSSRVKVIRKAATEYHYGLERKLQYPDRI